MSDKGITLEGLAAAVDALRQELATWKALARKQDALTAAQITATQSGATAAKISQIAVNTAAIQSLAAQVAGQISLEYVTTLPATGEPLTLYLVPQGDGTAPNYCNEYLWVNNDWELIGTTGSMANNGELTIQVNGVAVGTFTANQAANAAINITVPTDTAQLVNGAQYVDSAALQAALALKQNSLNTAQMAAVNSGITAALVTQIGTNQTAIAGKQDALTAAQQAAVDSGATVAKIDQIASNASAIVSLTSSKQDALTTTQLAACNSGITAAGVQQISTNASNITALQTAVASKAADSEVVHLAGAETITGNKTFTETISGSIDGIATRAVGDEDGNNIKTALAGKQSSLSQSQLDACNSGITAAAVQQIGTNASNISGLQTAISSKAADTEVVHLAGAETISGDKTHDANLAITGNKLFAWERPQVTRGTLPSSTVYYGTTRYRDANLNSFLLCRGSINSTGDMDYGMVMYPWLLDSSKGWSFYVSADGASVWLRPIGDNVHLGTASHKWLSFNGINPGALSLPSNSGVSFSGDITNTTGTTNNPKTWTVNGWGYIRVPNRTTSDFVSVVTSGSYEAYLATGTGAGNTNIGVSFPIVAGRTYNIYVSTSGNVTAYFFPCLGNV